MSLTLNRAILYFILILRKEKRNMIDMNAFLNVWDEFLAFMDRVVQWLQFLFANGEWPPEDYPNIDDEPAA